MAGENPARVAWTKTLRCLMAGLGDPCVPSHGCDAHHAGPRGMGQRAHDDTCLPLCRRHHMAWHDASGIFRDWKKQQRRAWARKQMASVQRRWERFLNLPQ